MLDGKVRSLRKMGMGKLPNRKRSLTSKTKKKYFGNVVNSLFVTHVISFLMLELGRVKPYCILVLLASKEYIRVIYYLFSLFVCSNNAFT